MALTKQVRERVEELDDGSIKVTTQIRVKENGQVLVPLDY